LKTRALLLLPLFTRANGLTISQIDDRCAVDFARELSKYLDQQDPRVDRRGDEGERGAEQDPIDATATAREQTDAPAEDGEDREEELREGPERPRQPVAGSSSPERRPNRLRAGHRRDSDDHPPERCRTFIRCKAEETDHEDDQQDPEGRRGATGEVGILQDRLDVDRERDEEQSEESGRRPDGRHEEVVPRGRGVGAHREILSWIYQRRAVHRLPSDGHDKKYSTIRV